MKKPNFRSYGNYQNEDYGTHSMVFTDLQGNSFYYSYETLVAFRTSKTGLVCRQNEWGTTTGKHLNWIEPNKKRRVTEAEFDRIYLETFSGEKKT